MTCIKCNERSKVLDSEETKEGWIKRRRSCDKCKIRWNTFEVPQDDIVVEQL